MPTGWQGSDRRRRLPKYWPQLRKRRLELDHYQCQRIREDTGEICGLKATDVDHIVNDKSGGRDSLSNLESLCDYHHQQKSSYEGAQASAKKRRKRPEWHPGITS